jgi:hypothetical protein
MDNTMVWNAIEQSKRNIIKLDQTDVREVSSSLKAFLNNPKTADKPVGLLLQKRPVIPVQTPPTTTAVQSVVASLNEFARNLNQFS